MDYKSLLSLAEKKQELNDSNNKFNIKKRSMNGWDNSGPDKSVINAFKARREREELEKRLKAQKEKEKLLSLRAQNSKSMRKAKMMKTRTKDNDFSRIVLTEEQIEEQRRVEEKLNRKGITDLCQRMKTRIDLEEEESSVPKKKTRVRNQNNNNNSNNDNNSSQSNSSNIDKQIRSKINDIYKGKRNNENKEKPRAEKPSMSYEQLLNLAAEKSKSEKKSLTDELLSEIETKKPVRPMTQKEKDALKEEQFYKTRANKGLARLPNPNDVNKNLKLQHNRREANKSQTIPKSNQNNTNSSNSKSEVVRNVPQKPPIETKQMQNRIPRNNESINSIRNNGPNQRINDKSMIDRQRIPQNRPDLQKPIQSSISSQSNKSAIIRKMDNRMNDKMNARKEIERVREKDNYEKYSTNSVRERPRDLEYNNNYKMQTKSEMNERVRPPSPPRRPIPNLPPIGSTYRRGMYEDVAQYVDDDYEEEDDDDMSDFIDDGPEEKPIEEDYSRAIREIFGYDKRKYRNVEDDDDIEEANFAQCMKEESRSLKIGIQEDLEDMRQEEEEKKQKLLQKKKLKR